MECKIVADFKQGLFCIDPLYGYILGDPLEKLPSYFETWNELAKNMPKLVETKKLRNKVNNSIPEQLAIPWYRLSEELDLKPVLTYADVIIINWRKKDENKPLELDNLRCLYNVTEGENAEWFLTVTIQIEFEFAAAIQSILEAIQAVSDSDTPKLNRCLREINDVILNMLKVFRRMHAYVSFSISYKNRWGTEGNSLPEGLIYEGIDDKPKKLVGGSAAQSSILQTLDAFLEIKHNKDKQMFLDEMKGYMPKPHRDFIDAIKKSPKVRNYVLQSNQQELIENYNTCVQNIEKFRSYHMTIVTKYVVNASSRGRREETFEKLAKRGTGGTCKFMYLFLSDIHRNGILVNY
ncbi:indoleamine 2,3-dioxygenase 1-like [Octopus bimaculoides]|uniref:indoleamine 2,3-dioxygenase 1-like n=1 Tax=Octopus bimaculoides TaxID=37653 RepID=UPI0022E3A251|nr:indoleamine 2,3-dioxygenase 1-like [Octopus bimaculoides]